MRSHDSALLPCPFLEKKLLMRASHGQFSAGILPSCDQYGQSSWHPAIAPQGESLQAWCWVLWVDFDGMKGTLRLEVMLPLMRPGL